VRGERQQTESGADIEHSIAALQRRSFEHALGLAQKVEIGELPSEVLAAMEAAIAQLSPAELAGVIASVPLAQQTQEMLRAIAFRQAEQRLLEHFALQADDRYGGN